MDYINVISKIFSEEQVKITILENLLIDVDYTQKIFDWLRISPIKCDELLEEKQNSSLAPNVVDIEALRELAKSYKHTIALLEDYLSSDLSIWTKQAWYL